MSVPDLARKIGRHVVIDELGRGGMGIVYRALDPQLGRQVAIKVIGDPTRIGPEERARFQREAQLSARLQHPGIVAVHQVGEQSGVPYLVMDLVRGRALDAVAREEELSPRRVSEIVRDVARALGHAHRRGILHRDVKPGNVLIDEDGRTRITDFGLAREVSAKDQLTLTGQIVGTPSFMAPEQADGENEHGPPTDVWSLGAVLYWGLVGKPPFEGDSPFQIIKRVLFDEPQRPRTLVPTVNVDLETIALKCLEKDAARRYATGDDVADELERFLDGQAIRARPDGPLSRCRRWARRNRLATMLLVLFVAAVAGGIGSRLHAGMEERGRFVADLAARARTSAEALDAKRGEVGDADALVIALDALGDARAWLAATPGDEMARRHTSRLAIATGEVALAAEQWSVATAAFRRARELGLDRKTAEESLGRVEEARGRAAEEHRRAVEGVLDRARTGEAFADGDARETALFELVRHGAHAIAPLCAELDAVTDALREATRAALLAAAEPTPDEARAGAQSIAGLREAVGALLDIDGLGTQELGRVWLHCPPAFEAARRRLGDRSARSRTSGQPLKLSTILSTAQASAVALDRRRTAALCADALGRLEGESIQPGARAGEEASAQARIETLGRHLAVQTDELEAAPAALALCRIGGPRAIAWLRVARNCHGTGGPLWRAIGGRLPVGWNETDGDAETDSSRRHRDAGDAFKEAGKNDEAIAAYGRALDLDPCDLIAWIRRGKARVSLGDLEGANADFDRVVALAPGFATAWGNRAGVRAMRGDLAGAVSDFERALELDPTLVAAWSGRGRMRQERGDLEGAIADYDHALALDPRCVNALSNRGAAKAAQGDLGGAIADYDRVLVLVPGDADICNRRGLIKFARQDAAGAISDYDRALELAPDHVGALNNRGLARASRNDLVGAIADYDRAVGLAPRNARIWSNRGEARAGRGDLDGAMTDLDRALELDPGGERAWIRRGKVRRARGDLPGATHDFDRALEISPGNIDALLNRAGARHDGGDRSGALEDLDRAVAVAPRFAGAWSRRGSVKLKRGDLEGAIADLDRALELDPRAATALTDRALIRRMHGDLDGAMVDLDRSLELAPRNVDSLANRGDLKQVRGDLAGAIADYDRALELDPRQPGIWVNRGNTKQMNGDLSGAISDYDRALELDPGLVEAYNSRGAAKYRQGDQEDALADLDQAIELDPRHVSAWFNRARVHTKLEAVPEAIDDLERVLALEPTGPTAERARAVIAELRKR